MAQPKRGIVLKGALLRTVKETRDRPERYRPISTDLLMAYNPNPQGRGPQGLSPGVKRVLRRLVSLILFLLLGYLVLIGLWVVLDPRW
jgi:hypothetical protein